MKEQLKNMVLSAIEKWTDNDIYVISLFVYDDDDIPCKPTVTLGYNTERQFAFSLKETDEYEARWNYAFWLQNEFFRFGAKDTAENVKEWVIENGFPYYKDIIGLSDEEQNLLWNSQEKITQAFVDVLVNIVQEIHAQKILTQKFGQELPIIIHELEYYDTIAKQNIKANGKELVYDFVDFCIGINNL